MAFASSWKTSTSQDANSFSINSSITLLPNVLITAISRYGVRVNLTAWMSVRVLSEEKIQVLGANSYFVNVILDKVLWSHLTGDWSLFPALYLMFYTNVPILLSLLLVCRIPDIMRPYKNRHVLAKYANVHIPPILVQIHRSCSEICFFVLIFAICPTWTS